MSVFRFNHLNLLAFFQLFRVVDDPLQISLRYNGRNVHKGSMPIVDVVLTLQGFFGAYGKVASTFLLKSSHQLRVAAVDRGSFEMTVVA